VASFPEAASSADELLAQVLAAVQRTSAASPVSLASSDVPGTPAPARAAAPVAASTSMRQLLDSAARLAKGAVPVLVLGETGAGKEVLARYLHDNGPRRGEPFVAVNCGAIPANLVESTLFGHEKGAFTGAAAQHRGVFESAGAGTVFLDEIGELPAVAQAALLRVLETKRITRIGSTRELDAPARIVAATHRDLEAMAATGAFRSDLLYRLNALTLHVPPLRDRREDLAELVDRFVVAANAANETAVRGIDPDALDVLRAYRWPGNVRELRNAIDRAVVIARGETITIDDLPARIRACEAPPPAAAQPAAALGDDFRTRLDRAERDILVAALREADWNQSECARRLRMPLRTLVYKIKAHGLKKLGYGAPE
jgi:two-component system response regulator AtoC